MDIVTEIVDYIYNNECMLEWIHEGVVELHHFGKDIVGKIPNFDLLRPLRVFLKKCTNLIPQVHLIDEIEFAVGH